MVTKLLQRLNPHKQNVSRRNAFGLGKNSEASRLRAHQTFGVPSIKQPLFDIRIKSVIGLRVLEGEHITLCCGGISLEHFNSH